MTLCNNTCTATMVHLEREKKKFSGHVSVCKYGCQLLLCLDEIIN